MENKNYKKQIVIFSFIFLMICFCFALFLYREELQVEEYDFKDSLIEKQDDSFTIQEFTSTEHSVSLKVIYDDPNEAELIYEYVLLKDTESDTCYRIPSEVIDRDIANEDGTTETVRDVVYGWISEDYIDLTKNYEVYILNQNDGSKDVIVPLNVQTKEDVNE